MNIKNLISPFYKHVGVLIIFVFVTFLSFTPNFNGKTLKQHDIKMWRGGAQECIDFREEHNGEETMWTNSMFGGMPSYLVSTIYPSNITRFLTKAIGLNLPRPACIFFTSLLCFYICAICFGVRWYWAIFGSIGFAFSTFNIISIGAGHNGKIVALGLLPLLIGGFKLIIDKKYLIGATLLAVGTTLELNAGHVQITYYGFFILLALGINELIKAIKSNQFKPFFIAIGISLVAGIIGLIPQTSRLWTLQEYGKYTIRGESELTLQDGDTKNGLTQEYVFAYSQGVKENLSLIAPDFFSNGQTKWSDGNSYPLYFGASVFIFFILGIVVLKPKEWVWLFTLSLLGILMALGKNFSSFNLLLYDYLPLYNKFRTVNMTLAITQFSMVLLATLALNKLFENGFELSQKVKITFYAMLGFIGLLFICTYIVTPSGDYDEQILKQTNPAYLQNIMDTRASDMRASLVKPFLFILGLLIVFIRIKIKETNDSNSLKQGFFNTEVYFGLAISALLFFDVSSTNSNFLNDDSYEAKNTTVITPTKANRYLMSKEGHFRILDATSNPFSSADASPFHHSIGGYHGAKIRRYQDIIDYHLQKNNTKVLQMLNTKYVIQNGNKKPIELPTLGNAWFINELIPVNNPDKEIEFLGKETFSPAINAVYDNQKFTFNTNSFDNKGNIEVKKYEPNKIIYESRSDKAGVGVFSEIYYSAGWKATIDNVEVPIKRVNYILRALDIPEGNHTIKFEFRPDSYYVGEKISFIGSLIIIGLILFTVFLYFKKKTVSDSKA